MFEYIDRELAELVWQEELELMSPAELAEMVRRQEEAIKADYFGQAFEAMRNAIEGENELDAVRDMLAA